MAAIIQAPRPRATTPARPALRLIEGGRSPRVLRMYRRRRALAAVLAAAVLTVVVIGALHLGGALATNWSPAHAAPVGGAEPAAAQVVVVRPGDTLWSIAMRLEPGSDPRPLVDKLQAAHGSAPLQAGERITITR